MSRYLKITFFVLFPLFLLTVTCQSNINSQIIKLGTGGTTFPAMIKEISSARVIFLGENHTDINHHKNQLDIIKALHEKGLPVAVGLEMFPKKDQKILDDWVSSRIKEKDFIPIFYENWGYGWGLYKDIFLYARNKKIPLIGLNVPREITRKVAQRGFKSLSMEELSELPPGITCDLDQRYMDFIKRIFEYKENNDDTFRNFCEAQVIWDQSMAWYLSQYLKANPERLVTVLSGTVHAWKYGIPRQLQKFITVKYRVILPDIPGDYRTITINDADYMVIH
ncbi:MAG: ChaN family lipoprotein [Nitrospirota bacterium]